MKGFKLFAMVMVLSFFMTSCFLFKKKHERCPAYGDNIQQEQQDQDVKPAELYEEEIRV